MSVFFFISPKNPASLIFLWGFMPHVRRIYANIWAHNVIQFTHVGVHASTMAVHKENIHYGSEGVQRIFWPKSAPPRHILDWRVFLTPFHHDGGGSINPPPSTNRAPDIPLQLCIQLTSVQRRKSPLQHGHWHRHGSMCLLNRTPSTNPNVPPNPDRHFVIVIPLWAPSRNSRQ